MEKVRADLLDIRQKQDTSEIVSGAETDREEGRQVQKSQEVSCRMQKLLNEYIRFHQLIIE
jgi:hypothetical protein